MAAIDAMRRYLRAVQRGDWARSQGARVEVELVDMLASEERDNPGARTTWANTRKRLLTCAIG